MTLPKTWGGMMEIILNKQAIKFLKRQEKAFQLRVYEALKGLKEKPPIGDIKKLKGIDNMYRLRIGTYRIIFTVDFQKETINILAINNRGDIY